MDYYKLVSWRIATSPFYTLRRDAHHRGSLSGCAVTPATAARAAQQSHTAEGQEHERGGLGCIQQITDHRCPMLLCTRSIHAIRIGGIIFTAVATLEHGEVGLVDVAVGVEVGVLTLIRPVVRNAWTRGA